MMQQVLKVLRRDILEGWDEALNVCHQPLDSLPQAIHQQFGAHSGMPNIRLESILIVISVMISLGGLHSGPDRSSTADECEVHLLQQLKASKAKAVLEQLLRDRLQLLGGKADLLRPLGRQPRLRLETRPRRKSCAPPLPWLDLVLYILCAS